MKFSNLFKTTLWAIPLVFMVGCGGGGGGSSSTSVSSFTGVLIDSAVAGALYKCSSGASGMTNNLGEYTCNVGDTVEFSIGGIVLGEVPVSDTVTPNTLFPNNSVAALNLAQFLQTLDSVGSTDDGITVDETLVERLEGMSFDFSDNNFDVLMGTALGKELVSETKAKEHLDDTLGRLTDTIAPVFTNVSSISVNENAISVITIVTDDETATLSLEGVDANLFSLQNSVLNFLAAPDFENDAHSYEVNIVATDKANNSATQTINITLLDINETAPDITAPTITSVNEVNVNEKSLNVLTITTDEVSDLTLSGTGADNFTLVDNVLSFSSALDYESDIHQFDLVITARDSSNNSSSQNLRVNLVDIVDTKPVLKNTRVSVLESMPQGSLIGNIVILDSGDASISRIILDGEGSENFSVSSNGEVKIATDASIDYETKSSYTLSVNAINAAGVSASVSLDIDIINVHDNTPVLDNFTTSLVENSLSNVEVGVLNIVQSGDSPITSMSLSGSGSDQFDIALDGTITVSNSANIDYEQKNRYDLQAVASNAAGDSNSARVLINIGNIADIRPEIDSLILFIAEDITAGSVIGNLNILTTGDTSISEIILSGTGSEYFSVTTSGEIKIAETTAIDYETKTAFKLTAVATNLAGSSASKAVNINILDVDEIAPLFTSSANISVNENAFDVLTVTTDDSEALLTLSGTDVNLFNFTNGVISFKNAPDYEKDKRSYSLSVTATDSVGNSAVQVLVISLLDVDETIPDTKAPLITSLNSVSIEENIKSVLTLTTDEVATLSLLGTDASKFMLKGNTLEFLQAPDFESDAQSYSLTIKATDDANNSSEQLLSITITDKDEIAPLFDKSSYTFSVEENELLIGDVGTDGKYDILSVSGADTTFIKYERGIKFITARDYENDKHNYSVIVTARDEAGNEASVNVEIIITDVAEDVPILADKVFTVSEDAAEGTLLGNILVDSGDTPITEMYLYYTGNENFSIALNGDIRVAAGANLDYETTTSYRFRSRAVNGAVTFDYGGTDNASELIINITNVLDVKPLLQEAVFSISEGAEAGSVVGTVDILESGDSPITQISLSGEGSENFTISTTGELSLSNSVALDFETKTSYELSAVATNRLGESPAVVLTINISDSNDNIPLFTNPSSVSVDENQISVLQLSATDADSSDSLTFSLISGADAESFNLSRDGILTFKVAPDYETKSTYLVRVALSDTLHTLTQIINVSINDLDELIEHNGFSYDEVTSPTTGRVWLDRNLGSSKVCDSLTDSACYGNYFQYGRNTDGHELLNANTSEVLESDIAATSANFVLTSESWLDGDTEHKQKVKNWAKTDGTSVCPVGYRVPTIGELRAEQSTDFLNLALANIRSYTSGTIPSPSREVGNLISLSRSGDNQGFLSLEYDSLGVDEKTEPDYSYKNINSGFSVRCIAADDEILFIDSQSHKLDITEEQAFSTAVEAVNIYDESEIVYSLEAGDDAALFTIDSASGVVSLNETKDYELDKQSYTITVIASNGHTQISKTLTMKLLPVDEYDPVVHEGDGVSIGEGSPTVLDVSIIEGATAVMQINATDRDVNENAQITYRFRRLSSSVSDWEMFDINSTTGVLTLKVAADREVKDEYILSVIIDSENRSIVPYIRVSVEDLNDNLPVIHNDTEVVVDENSLVAVELNVTDLDTSDTISYSLKRGDDSQSFDINSSSGVISFKSAPDYEAGETSFSIVAIANDGVHSVEKAINISVIDVNDNTPIVQTSSITIPENQTQVATLTAIDGDTHLATTLTYSLESGEDTTDFTLSSSGELSLKNPADYEVKNSYRVHLSVSDGELSSQKTVVVNISDVGENIPSFTSPNTARLDENSNASFLTIIAQDADVADTLSITLNESYGDGTLFELTGGVANVSDGKSLKTTNLSFKVAPDYENDKHTYFIRVNVNDGMQIAEQKIAIYLDDLNDNLPVGEIVDLLTVEDEDVSITLIAEDADTDELTCSLNAPSNGTVSNISASGCSFVFTPNENFTGSVLGSYSVSDGLNVSESYTISLFVQNVNDTPIITSAAELHVDEQDSFSFTIQASDADGDDINFAIVNTGGITNLNLVKVSRTTATLTGETGRITATQLKNFTLSVSDASQSSSQGYTLRVANSFEDLSVRSVAYDKVNDELYIYYSDAINPDSISTDRESDYSIVGSGAIGSSAQSSYDANITMHHLSLNTNSNTWTDLVAGTSTLSFAEATGIRTDDDLKVQAPVSYAAPTVEAIVLIPKTGNRVRLNTGDDGDLEKGAPRSYTKQNKLKTTTYNGVMKDNVTGLYWQDDETVSKTYSQAVSYCGSSDLGGKLDWRLPTASELVQLVDYGVTTGAKIDSAFTNKTSYNYWSKSGTGSRDYRYSVSFNSGEMISSAETTSNRVRCVR